MTSTPTTARNVRVPDDLWQAARRKAELNQTTVSEEINRFLADWVGVTYARPKTGVKKQTPYAKWAEARSKNRSTP